MIGMTLDSVGLTQCMPYWSFIAMLVWSVFSFTYMLVIIVNFFTFVIS